MSHSKRFMGRLRRATHLRGGLAGRSVAAAMILAPALSLALSGAGGALAQPTPSGEGDVSAAAVQTYSTSEFITIHDGSNADPYPSRLTVSSLPGRITDVNVSLKSITHSNVSDIDILLVSPSGESTIILSDVGGDRSVVTTNLILDDQAAGPVPTPITSGTYKSTNSADADTDFFGSPAPNPPSGTDLSIFDTRDPNGTWKLYVRDDRGNNLEGTMGGWGLKITTQNSPPKANDDSYTAKAGQKLTVNKPGVLKNDRDPDKDRLTVKRVVTKPDKGKLNLNSNGSFTYTPKDNAKGNDSFVYEVQDTGGLTDQARVTIDIK